MGRSLGESGEGRRSVLTVGPPSLMPTVMDQHIADYIAGRVACPLCDSGRKCRAAFPGHYGKYSSKARRRLLMAKFISRRVVENGQAAGSKAPAAGEWAGLYPAIVEYLVQTEWAEGTPRLASTMLLFAEDGLWKCCFTDKDQSRMAFLAAETPTKLLQLVELGLQKDSLDWRPWTDWRKKKKN